jgi:DNA-binding transcriptional MerR regulator
MTSEETEPTFAIGAVSRLTGIPVDTIRVWERRYDVVEPVRGPNNKRSYTREDIGRLTLIKQLVDQGHAVGSLVRLPEEALRARLRIHAEAPIRPARSRDKLSVLIQGDALPFLVESWRNDLPGLDILGLHTGYTDFEDDVLDRKPDVLVVECAALQPDQALKLHELARRAAVRRLVMVYGFGESAVVDRVRKLGITAVRAPITARALEDACRDIAPDASALGLVAEADAEVPPRQFDSETLAAVAAIPTTVRCECPHHLADLVFRLSAFESYSLDCENRNEQDAALHAELYRTTARARALMETALAYLIRFEGLQLPTAGAGETPPASDWAGTD